MAKKLGRREFLVSSLLLELRAQLHVALRSLRGARLSLGVLAAVVTLSASKLGGAQGTQPDIVIEDFEGSTWGSWTVTGTAWGTGPVSQTPRCQQQVTGYAGYEWADSFVDDPTYPTCNGTGLRDQATGTLTSPAFTIQRHYIKFETGGGSYRADGYYSPQTAIKLLVGGNEVRKAVGSGTAEVLDWLQWDVSSYLNQTAQIQLVDTATGGWGHLLVDDIVQSDTPLSAGVITITHRYLNFPVKASQPRVTLDLIGYEDALSVQDFKMRLAAPTDTPDYYVFMDASRFSGRTFILRVNGVAADRDHLGSLIQSDSPVTSVPFYQESLRPIYHITARRGAINDPNGMVYINNAGTPEYHVSYQHNPYDTVVGNQHWGHVASTDLVHWQELPEALWPDTLGQTWSGSSVVDSANTAGFGAGAIVSFYTAAGGHGNNNLMSQGQLFTQCLAYSVDSNRTYVKYGANPIIPNIPLPDPYPLDDNRDPFVFWYAPGKKWVMVLWLADKALPSIYGIFSSRDLIHWTQTQTFPFPDDVKEVPMLVQLPVDGDPNNQKWMFWGGAGRYYVGSFDGNTFTIEEGYYNPKPGQIFGNSFAASQIFSNIPDSDGRKILIANGTGSYPGTTPFNFYLTFPVELSLHTTPPNQHKLYFNPIREIQRLYLDTTTLGLQPLPDGIDLLAGRTGEAFDMDVYFEPGTASAVTFTVAGTTVVYNVGTHQLDLSSLDPNQSQTLDPINGVVHLRMLADRGTLEMFGNDGALYKSMRRPPVNGPQPIGIVATGAGAQLDSLTIHNLGSAW